MLWMCPCRENRLLENLSVLENLMMKWTRTVLPKPICEMFNLHCYLRHLPSNLAQLAKDHVSSCHHFISIVSISFVIISNLHIDYPIWNWWPNWNFSHWLKLDISSCLNQEVQLNCSLYTNDDCDLLYSYFPGFYLILQKTWHPWPILVSEK